MMIDVAADMMYSVRDAVNRFSKVYVVILALMVYRILRGYDLVSVMSDGMVWISVSFMLCLFLSLMLIRIPEQTSREIAEVVAKQPRKPGLSGAVSRLWQAIISIDRLLYRNERLNCWWAGLTITEKEKLKELYEAWMDGKKA